MNNLTTLERQLKEKQQETDDMLKKIKEQNRWRIEITQDSYGERFGLSSVMNITVAELQSLKKEIERVELTMKGKQNG